MRLLAAIPAIFMLALAASVMIGTAGLNYWDGFTPGARFFPGWLAGAGAVFSILLLVTQWRGTDPGVVELPERQGTAKVLATMAGLVGLALLSPTLGMVPAVALFMLFLLLAVLRAPLLPSLLTTLIVAVGIQGIFGLWLGVPMPTPFFL